jgi:hypothetical protein
MNREVTNWEVTNWEETNREESEDRAVPAKRITAALLLVICIMAAVFA